MSYTEVFGGNTIFPSDVSYLALALTGPVSLSWPLESAGGDTPAARIIDITPTAAFTITLPPADRASVGEVLFFNNIGPHTVTINDDAGGTVLVVASGEQWQAYLTNTDTAAGSWRTFRFGAATASAQSSALAGFGTKATGSTLSQDYPSVTTSTSFSVGASNRAATYIWTGGSGTVSLLTAAAATSGFFFNIHNNGAGALTLDPAGGEEINGGSTIVLDPGDSASVVCTGTAWFTIGLGKDAVFAFDYTSIDLTGQSSPFTLSGAELNRIAYKFTGVLTEDMEIIVPPTIQQYWADNDTSGSFVLGLKTATQVGNANIAQGARAIQYCDGLEVIAADTSSISVPIALADGGTGATTSGNALINLGGTSDGISIFTAVSTNAIWAVLGAAPAGTVDGGQF